MEAVYREHPISQDLDRLTTLKELQELGHGKDRLLNAQSRTILLKVSIEHGP